MLWLPPTLADSLIVEVEADAGEDWVEGMIQYNAAVVEWLNGRLDTETFFQMAEYWLQEPEPVELVQESLDLYLPGVEPL